MVKTFIKKPVEIQAVQWTGDNYDEILNFTGELNVEYNAEYWNKLIIHTLEGNHYVSARIIFSNKLTRRLSNDLA